MLGVRNRIKGCKMGDFQGRGSAGSTRQQGGLKLKSWLGSGSKIRRKGLNEVQKKGEAAVSALRCDREERERGAAAERYPGRNSAPLSARRGDGEGWGFKSAVSGNLKDDSMCERSRPGKT